tara:strand:+ start:1745 stop:2434 length:690 start_codon:yes stop_codon:yes gene_type:complete
MYRFKLKEIKVGDIEVKSGKQSTVTDIDDTTGTITWDVKDVADFSSTYKELEQAKKFLRDLEQTGKAKDDTTLDKLADELSSIFNKFRTHIRKTYPEEYERVLRLKEEEIDEGEGIGYLTPFAFNKNKKSTGAADIYYYKLGFKPVPKIKPKSYDIKQLFEFNDMQKGRISGFDKVEEKVNAISALLSNAKNETIKYYNENPGSYDVVYSTDMISELLDDITKMLKQSE